MPDLATLALLLVAALSLNLAYLTIGRVLTALGWIGWPEQVQ